MLITMLMVLLVVMTGSGADNNADGVVGGDDRGSGDVGGNDSGSGADNNADGDDNVGGDDNGDDDVSGIDNGSGAHNNADGDDVGGNDSGSGADNNADGDDDVRVKVGVRLIFRFMGRVGGWFLGNVSPTPPLLALSPVYTAQTNPGLTWI